MYRKVIATLLTGMLTLSLAGCTPDSPSDAADASSKNAEVSSAASGDDSVFVFADTIAFTEKDGKTVVDLTHSSTKVNEKYQQINTIFSDLPSLDRIAVGTTTTANLLYELGITVVAAPESASLHADLTALQSEGGKIVNIGSALTPNVESVVQSKPDVFFVSDAMPHNDTYDALEQLGINVQPFAQSDFTDMILLVQVLDHLVGQDNQKPQQYLTDMKQDLRSASTVKESYKGESPTAVILQKMPETNFINGGESVLGGILSTLNITNVFQNEKNSELNLEALIQNNPQHILVHGHGMGVKPSELTDFIAEMKQPDSPYQTIDAVKNDRVFSVANDDFIFSGSVDLDITKTVALIAQNIYGE